MRRFVTAGALALFVALFAGCSEQASDSPTEPQFGKKNKVTYDCEAYGLQEQLDALNEATESILMHRPTVKGALSNIDNTARKVCVDDPNYGAALEQYYEFETLINGQNVSKLVGGETARQALLSMAYSFATGGDYNPGFSIPPEALDPDGGLFVIPSPGDIPAEGLDLVAGSLEGALRIFPGTFPPEAFPVTIVEYRLPDDYDGSGDGYSFDPYIPLPEIWWFEASAQPDPEGPGFEVWVCVVDDSPDLDTYYRSVIAHALDGGGVELLEPPIYDNSPLNCANAAFDSNGLASAGTPGWLRLAGTILEPVVNRILGVKPLHAMYFAGKGLGGRGGSLSPHAPVVIPDPVIAYDSSRLNIEDPASPGDSINYYYFTTTNVADYPNYLFEALTPGGCPSRTSLEIFDAAEDTLINSLCDFDSPDDIATFSFVTPAGQGPPDIYVELWDRDLDRRYRSNTHVFIPVFRTLTVVGAGDGSGYLNGGIYFDCTYDGVSTSGDCEGSWEEWVRVRGITPTANTGSTFDGWSGDCTGPTCDVNMDVDRNATMTFSLETAPDYSLSLGVGANGTVSDNKENGPCGPSETCPYSYSIGDFEIEEQLVLRATPNVGYSANVTWVGCTSSFRLDCFVTPAASMNVSADFVPLLLYELTITLNFPNGVGTVTDGVQTCDANNTPCVWTYTEGTNVTLTGTSSGENAENTNIFFQDDCEGNTGTATATCDLLMNGDKATQVDFEVGV